MTPALGRLCDRTTTAVKPSVTETCGCRASTVSAERVEPFRALKRTGSALAVLRSETIMSTLGSEPARRS